MLFPVEIIVSLYAEATVMKNFFITQFASFVTFIQWTSLDRTQ